MLTFKSVLIILAVSCISGNGAQDSQNVKVIRAGRFYDLLDQCLTKYGSPTTIDRDWDYYDTLPETEGFGIEDLENGHGTLLEEDPDDHEIAPVQETKGITSGNIRVVSITESEGVLNPRGDGSHTNRDIDAADYEITTVQEREGINNGINRLSSSRNAVVNASLHWPDGRVPYVFDAHLSADIQNMTLAAMRQIEEDAKHNPVLDCVKFIPKANEENYIYITWGNTCTTYVGMYIRGRQNVTLSAHCRSKGKIMHELMHVLGFMDEHRRYDRDQYININMANVRANQIPKLRKAPVGEITYLSTNYDLTSIMHFGPYNLALDKSIPVITPIDVQNGALKIGQRLALSTSDVLRIQRQYHCFEGVSQIVGRRVTDSVVTCDFSDGMCNFTDDTAAGFHWEVIQGSTPSGPHAGNTNGADPYLAVTELGYAGYARIKTPFFTVSNDVCVNFYRFQRGPAFLSLRATGRGILPLQLSSFRGRNFNGWIEVQTEILFPPTSVDVQITFIAQMLIAGNVAIDDVNIYRGKCI